MPTNFHEPKAAEIGFEHSIGLRVAPPTEYGRFPDVKAHFGLTRSKTYDLLRSGAIRSCCVKRKGARHGVRLIDMQSVRDFLKANTH